MKTYAFRGEIRRPCVVTIAAETFEEALARAREGFGEEEESSVSDTEVFDDGEKEALRLATDCGFNEEESCR